MPYQYSNSYRKMVKFDFAKHLCFCDLKVQFSTSPGNTNFSFVIFYHKNAVAEYMLIET